jgi:hypothetical protein
MTVPYPMTVIGEDGLPCGMLYPDGTYISCPKSRVGAVEYDAEEGREVTVVWDGTSRISLLR